mmetsp:Transcript_112181/g.175196  ORF Transcript_112181/g.175196 Transcript_112181/m.175196 type:complete len:211 (+) Transcript_112181:339-971(+)
MHQALDCMRSSSNLFLPAEGISLRAASTSREFAFSSRPIHSRKCSSAVLASLFASSAPDVFDSPVPNTFSNLLLSSAVMHSKAVSMSTTPAPSSMERYSPKDFVEVSSDVFAKFSLGFGFDSKPSGTSFFPASEFRYIFTEEKQTNLVKSSKFINSRPSDTKRDKKRSHAFASKASAGIPLKSDINGQSSCGDSMSSISRSRVSNLVFAA